MDAELMHETISEIPIALNTAADSTDESLRYVDIFLITLSELAKVMLRLC